jgi:hypothetical protein
MKTVAQISFQGGGLVVPARDQYDREVAFEHAEAYARRHGHVRLELDGDTMTIGLNGTSGHTCSRCEIVLGLLTYTFGHRYLCARCVREAARLDGGTPVSTAAVQTRRLRPASGRRP